MAGKSSLLFLVLLTLSVCISAHRPLVVEKHGRVIPSSPAIKEDNSDAIDHVDLRKVDTVNPNVEQFGGGIYPSAVPALGRDGGFQFQLGPIGFGASWSLGFPIPIFGPQFVLPQNVWPYYQSAPYLSSYEFQVRSQGQGSGQPSSLESPMGNAPAPSSKGLNSPSTPN